MAKKRLVDFRGGINQKISPHMIGDSQGQSAQDTDLSSVRLQGRKKQNTSNTSDKANGDFFYSYGNVARNTDGRWVSTDPTDTSHIADSTDFEVWNRDLYVARRGGSSDGTILRFLDGATSSSQSLTLNAPSSFNLTEDYAYQADSASFVVSTVDSLRGGKGKQLKAAVAGQAYVASQTVTVTTGNASQFSPAYTSTGATDSARNRVIWTQGTTNYYQNPNPITSGGSEYTIQSETSSTTTTVLSWTNAYWISANQQGGQQIVHNWSCNYIIKSISSSSIELRQGSFGGSFGNSFINAHNYWVGRSPASAGIPSSGPLVAGSNPHLAVYSGSVAGHSVNDYRIYGISSTSVGTVTSVQWHSVTNQTNPSSSSPTAITLHGSNFSNSLSVGANFSLSLYFQRVQGTQQTNYTFSDKTDTIPAVPLIAGTPVFTSDDARHFIYRQYTSADGSSPSWTTDSAEGAGGGGTPWLGSPTHPRLQNTSASGYYLTAIVGQSGTNLPEESQDKRKASLVSSNSVFGTDAVTTPNQLVLSSIAATTPAAACYRLLRVDSESTEANPTNLGFILPNQSESFSVNNSGNIEISSLAAAEYKLNWTCYQNTKAEFTYNGVTQAAVKSTGTVATNGVSFTGVSGSNLTVTLSDNSGDNSDFRGVDIWLERRVLTGSTSAIADTYAIVKCFQYFKNDDTNIANIEEECDFLDVFASGLSSGSISGSGNLTAPPDHLKLLKESNNFFFAVGTIDTEPGRYGGSVSYDSQGNATYTANPNVGNKADSFLFVSNYNNPRDWPIDAYVEFDASITGLATYPGELIVFTENGVYRVTGSRANQMRKAKLATTEGLQENQNKTIALVDNYLVWVSQSGICFYNGSTVTNLTKGRFEGFTLGQSVAGQLDGKYYVVQKSNEVGYVVDFTLEGFPVSSIDLSEDRNLISNGVLHYVPSRNKLYSRHGFVEGSSDRNTFSYTTREFDGDAFGSLKLVKNVTVNGSGTGNIQVLLDGQPAFTQAKTVSLASGYDNDQPARVYLPASRSNNPYNLSVADVWSVEITNWNGKIDWIDTEYEVLTD